MKGGVARRHYHSAYGVRPSPRTGERAWGLAAVATSAVAPVLFADHGAALRRAREIYHQCLGSACGRLPINRRHGHLLNLINDILDLPSGVFGMP